MLLTRIIGGGAQDPADIEAERERLRINKNWYNSLTGAAAAGIVGIGAYKNYKNTNQVNDEIAKAKSDISTATSAHEAEMAKYNRRLAEEQEALKRHEASLEKARADKKAWINEGNTVEDASSMFDKGIKDRRKNVLASQDQINTYKEEMRRSKNSFENNMTQHNGAIKKGENRLKDLKRNRWIMGGIGIAALGHIGLTSYMTNQRRAELEAKKKKAIQAQQQQQGYPTQQPMMRSYYNYYRG